MLALQAGGTYRLDGDPAMRTRPMAGLLDALVELGAAELVPLETRRGVAAPNDKALERLRRTVIEASKQCGRNRLMQIQPSADVAALGAAAPPDSLRLLADPQGAPIRSLLQGRPDAELWAAVGPEGGFDDAEKELLTAAGFAPAALGRSILRVETAAAALTAIATLDMPSSHTK